MKIKAKLTAMKGGTPTVIQDGVGELADAGVDTDKFVADLHKMVDKVAQNKKRLTKASAARAKTKGG